MSNEELLSKFYEAFKGGDVNQMVDCYHEDVVFSDPAFGTLHGNRAKGMWKMLIERGKGANKITYTITEINESSGQVRWTAKYPYGPKSRKVINHVTGTFKFADSKIIEHHDNFSLYNWSKQALGLPGHLLGWSSFMRSKIQKKTNNLLDTYLEKRKE